MRRNALPCAILLALTATANGQLRYETSTTPKPGFTLATQQQLFDVIKQETRLTLHVRDAADMMDQPGGGTSPDSEMFGEPIRNWLVRLPAAQIIPGLKYYVVRYDRGSLLFEAEQKQIRIRYKTQTSTGTPVFVRVTGTPEAPERPRIDPEILKAFIAILTPDQRVELMKQLVAMGVEVTP